MMGYVFDLDGTLVDSVPTLLRVINSVLDDNGFLPSDREENLSVAGWGLAAMFERTLKHRTDDEKIIRKLTSRMLDLYREDPCTGTVGYPGALETLLELTGRGEAIGVITNKLSDPAYRILLSNFPGVKFTKVYSPDGGWEPKPSNVSLLDFRKRYAEDRLTYVGDTELDYRTALGTADSIKLAVWGYRGRDTLLGMGFPEDILIEDFAQIL